LIHRHFGTKAELIKEAHTILITQINAEIPPIENIENNVGLFFEAARKNKLRQLALARAMIEGVSPYALQNEFPVMQRLVQLLKKRADESETEKKFSPKISAAALGAIALGWILYEPFLFAATDLDNENPDEIHREVIEILEEFVKKIC
jgi:AcrR family transcriptional regulator